MGYLGEDIRNLGFGLMRLPRKDEKIDIEQVKEMVDLFMDAGFTYFDTAWAYEDNEEAIRQALIERYPRKSFQLATKNAAWITADSRENAMKQLETSLERTGAGYFDFYLLHNLGQKRTKVFDDFDMWNFVQEKKAEGLIRHVGFSFHSTAEELEEISKAHPEAEFVQLQINYADWALRYAADLDGLITVLSGMSNVEQMKDNLSFMKDFHKLTDTDRAVIAHAQEELSKIPLIPCTSCDYCAKVCPNDIGISVSFAAMNNYTLYGNKAFGLNDMMWNIDRQGKKRAHECIKCGACEDACPQRIAIRDELDKVAEVFAQ